MCYAIPGKVTEVKGRIAVIDYFGEKRNALNDFEEAQEGDYVYAQGGIVIDKIPQENAVEILKTWKEKFIELKKIDEKLDQNKIQTTSNILELLQKVNLKKELNRNEMKQLLKLNDEASLKLLYNTANNTRRKELGNACCVHGIIEFSNYCKNNCQYCGIRKDRKIKRYRMNVDEIIRTAKYATKELGFKALVLQSGEDYWYDEEKLYKIVSEIRKLHVLIFLSIGIRSKETYRRLYEAGARAILLRFETANKETFRRLRPGTNFDERISLIKHLKEAGYIIATGFISGLPGETYDDIIENILLTKSLKADMHSFGPLIPAKGTPLEKSKQVRKDSVLKTIAISRLADRESKILVTSALETLDKNAKKEGLMSGANSLMINITPAHYKELYELYPGRPDKNKNVKENIQETIKLLYSLGRSPTDLGL